MNCKLGIVIQARTGSTRLPGKITLDFYNGNSVLDIILDKICNFFGGKIPIVLATSSLATDSDLKVFAAKRSIFFFQGNESDVLDRFIEVGEKYNFSHMVRVCADNPLLNMASINKLINQFNDELNNGKEIDYLSYCNIAGTPVIKSHLGLFVEIVSLKALKQAFNTTDESVFHEHVTNYIYTHSQNFNVLLIPAPEPVIDRDDIRLTIDNIDDFQIVSEIYRNVKKNEEDIEYIVSFLDKNEQYLNRMAKNINNYIK